jgi:hypothetical protein
MLFELSYFPREIVIETISLGIDDYFPRDNSHDQSSKLFKQNQQLDFYVQNSNFISI